MKNTKFYKVWENMKSRCGNKNHKSYKHYGGRGITVCQEWLDFNSFRDDMYGSYLSHVEEHGQANTKIERKDVNRGYSKANCTWATYKAQARNMRSNVTYKGEVAIDASKRLGGTRGMVRQRLVYGWSKKRAFTAPAYQAIDIIKDNK